MGRKRVLFITNRLYIGGLERVALDLCRAMRRVGEWEPIIHHLEGLADDESLRPSFLEAGVRLVGFPPSDRFQPERVAAIRRFVQRERIDVLHTHDLGPLIHGSLVKLSLFGKIRLVHTAHTFVHVQRRRKAAVYESLFPRFADELCVVAPHLRAEYRRLGIRREIRVCENGLFFPEGPITPEVREQARRELAPSFDPTENWILCLARIDSGKGQDHVLNLWEALPPLVRQRSRLWFVGPFTTSESRLRLESLIRKTEMHERVHCPGPSSDPARWFRAASVFVSGSESEGMAMAPLEAAGAGVPCLLSDIPGHAVLRDYALFFPLGDIADGAIKLERLLGLDGATTWESSEPLRRAHGAQRMALEYSRLYAS